MNIEFLRCKNCPSRWRNRGTVRIQTSLNFPLFNYHSMFDWRPWFLMRLEYWAAEVYLESLQEAMSLLSNERCTFLTQNSCWSIPQGWIKLANIAASVSSLRLALIKPNVPNWVALFYILNESRFNNNNVLNLEGRESIMRSLSL